MRRVCVVVLLCDVIVEKAQIFFGSPEESFLVLRPLSKIKSLSKSATKKKLGQQSLV